MAKFLIEVPHGSDKIECLHSVSIFLSSGSHFLSHADWGCMDGEHKAWFTMEANSKEEARLVVPPAYRRDAKISQLNSFKLEDVQELLKHHKA
jgi:hypothetical protein